MASEDEVTTFEPSKLGTKQYWDEAYQVEYVNFKDHGDEGEIWFGKQCEKRIIDWCKSNFAPDSTSVLDIGSGNGHMLLSLAKKGFLNLVGGDYSENAVALGKALFEGHPELPCAKFIAVDFLDLPVCVLEEYDLLIDKGTFDAISLMATESQEEGKSAAHMERVRGLCSRFKTSLLKLWRSTSTRFIITSCNWTLAELTTLFAPEFTVEHQIEHPSFNFGGASGQVVTTLVLARK